MMKEKEVCQKCGGELDPVFGLCIGECKKLDSLEIKVDDTELWNDVLNALGYGFVNREKFIKEAQQRYTITRKNNQ